MKRSPVITSILAAVKANIALLIVLILTMSGAIAFSLIPPLVLEGIVNSLEAREGVTLLVAISYFVFILLQGVFDALKEVIINVFGQKITHKIRYELIKKLSRLPQGYFVENETGKTVSRFVSDVDAIDSLFKNGVISMLVDLVKIVCILVVIFTKSLGLGLLMLLITPIIYIVSRIFKKRMRVHQIENRKAIAKINNHIPETASSIRTVRNLQKQDYMRNKFEKYTRESYLAGEKNNFYESLYTPFINELSVLIVAAMMLLCSVGGPLRELFGVGVGTAVAIIAYVGKIFSPIENIGMEIQNLQAAVAGIKRVDEMLNAPEKPQTEFDFSSLDITKPCVEFRNIDFSYGEENVLSKLSFKVDGGENVTLIGRTGAGKSTVYKLILGLFEPQDGEVLLFGVSAHKICDSAKRRIIGYVEQQIQTVNGTLREQITLYDQSITDEAVVSALKLSCLYDCVSAIDGGLDAKYQLGMFSQGQLQLLAIARAVVTNPLLLLLDEITANLDSETEREVVSAISLASKNRTVISVSHRGGGGANTRFIEIKK